MGGGLHFLVEIELEMAKMPAFTNLKVRVKLWNLADLDFDLDPNQESTPNLKLCIYQNIEYLSLK